MAVVAVVAVVAGAELVLVACVSGLPCGACCWSELSADVVGSAVRDDPVYYFIVTVEISVVACSWSVGGWSAVAAELCSNLTWVGVYVEVSLVVSDGVDWASTSAWLESVRCFEGSECVSGVCPVVSLLIEVTSEVSSVDGWFGDGASPTLNGGPENSLCCPVAVRVVVYLDLLGLMLLRRSYDAF